MVEPLKVGEKAALAVIFRPRCLKTDVLALGLRLTAEECEGATAAFHKQGPRLWGFWCDAMHRRKKLGQRVPKVWQD